MSKVIEKNLSYPIGQYQQQPFSIDKKVEWMADIKFLPLQLENAVLNLDESQLHVPYREGGWTIQQIVHHVADSHMNAYIRFKLGVTESHPTIKPYNEQTWAETSEARTGPVSLSLPLLETLHQRWVTFLKSLDASAFARTIMHPEKGTMTLDE